MTAAAPAHRAAVLTAPRAIALQNVQAPPLGPMEVRARVLRAGVCGTDLALFTGDYPVPLPLVPGHEWVGVVEQAGGADGERLLGQTVVAEINNSCRAYRRAEPCPACARGLDTHCQRRTVTGIIDCDGAFAETITAPLGNVHTLPEDFPVEQGVLIEPLAAALQTFTMSPAEKDAKVLVLGGGRLGLLIAIVAAHLEFDVRVVGRSDERLALAREFKLETWRLGDPTELAERARAFGGGVGADVVVEATGSPAGLALALRCVRPRGTLALKSTPGRPIDDFPLTQTVVDEVRLQGSRCGDFAQAIAFHRRHRLDLSPILRHEFPLAEIERAFEYAARQPGKTVIVF